MIKKFYSIFFKKSQVQDRVLVAFRRRRNLLFPKISSARGSKISADILCRGRIARASPMKKGRSMRPFFITERGQHFRFTQSVGLRGPARHCRIFDRFPSLTVRWTVKDGTTLLNNTYLRLTIPQNHLSHPISRYSPRYLHPGIPAILFSDSTKPAEGNSPAGLFCI